MLSNTRNYRAAIEILNQLQSRRQMNVLKSGEKLKAFVTYLNRCGITLERLDELSVVHVTGTHGKGSTCVYTENILRNHGYKTGFFSSPHVLEVRERIRISGKPISKNIFAHYFWKVYDMLDNQKENESDMPMYFPFLTVLAFHIFLEHKVDVAIVEVGIGGEYDCTNVVRNTVAAGMTPISIDHTSILGASLESIAWNKGGIMKENCAAFSVEQCPEALEVLMERSRERKCELTIVGKNSLINDTYSTKIPDHVMRTNASLALALSEAFIKKMSSEGRGKDEFSSDVALRAIETAFWPGRYEIKQVKAIRFFLDGAHTAHSLSTCSSWFRKQTRDSRNQKVLIFNITGDRDARGFLSELLPCKFDIAIFIPNIGQEKITADTADFKSTTNSQLTHCKEYRQVWMNLENEYGQESKSLVLSSFAEALALLDNGIEYDTLVTGSLYLVGAALSVLDPTLKGLLDE